MMNFLLSSVSSSAIIAGGDPGPLDPFITARYWRIDNMVCEDTSFTEIVGMTFVTINRTGSVVHTPTSITSNLGDATTALNRNWAFSGSGTATTYISDMTYIDFEYPTAIAPNQFALYNNELAVDYLISFDISFSTDGVTWIKCGQGNVNDNTSFMNRISTNVAEFYFNTNIGTYAGQLAVDEAILNVVIGRNPTGVSITDAKLYALIGRSNQAATIHEARLWVITEPA